MKLCKHGHEMTPENTYTLPRGSTMCRVCLRGSQARSKARRARGERARRPGYCARNLHDLNEPANVRARTDGKRQCAPCRINQQTEKYRKLKRECLDAYGGVCYCCGESEVAFLTIEHLNNDGGEHRRQNGTGGSQSYRWLRKQGYPQDLGLAVACFNCNSGRAVNGGVCPHALTLADAEAR